MAFNDAVRQSQKLVKRNPDASAMSTDLPRFTSRIHKTRKMARKLSVQAFWPILIKWPMTVFGLVRDLLWTTIYHNISHLSRVISDVVMQTAQSSWVRFNVPPNTLYVISGTDFCGSNEWPNQQCQALKEDRVLRIRLQSHQVHPTLLL